MRRHFILAAAILLCATGVSVAGGMHDSSGNRDYDRGFFINLEGFWATPEDLPNEWAVSDGNVHEVDFHNELTPRITIGGAFGKRVGTFSLTYWEYDETETAQATGASVQSTIFGSSLGTFGRGDATDRVEARTFDLNWTKGYAAGRKFHGGWGLGLRYWEYEERLQSGFGGPARRETVDAEVDSDGFGLRVGAGGYYSFVPRFGIGGGAWLSFLDGDTLTTVNTSTGVSRREDDDKIFSQIEAVIAFFWNPTGGLRFSWGYRFQEFGDAVDLAIGPGGGEDVRFSGPFFGIGYNFGVEKVDSDGDGVLDYLDDCPGTPAGCIVDENGCHTDADSDGVCDGVDRCTGTPFGCRVDAEGCSLDEDDDGVCDGLDLCPGTAFGCHVDGKGCPRDSDGDGVCDGMDFCPGTPSGAEVDDRGCSYDSDGDTVPDVLDRCPNTPRGVEVDEWGCEKELILQQVQFDFDKATIKREFHGVLDKLVKGMKSNGGMQIHLHGHTDWIGTEQYNLGLSKRRCDAVKGYLVDRGVDKGRIATTGHGECCPIAPNTTDEGRYKNRRVEVERTR